MDRSHVSCFLRHSVYTRVLTYLSRWVEVVMRERALYHSVRATFWYRQSRRASASRPTITSLLKLVVLRRATPGANSQRTLPHPHSRYLFTLQCHIVVRNYRVLSRWQRWGQRSQQNRETLCPLKQRWLRCRQQKRRKSFFLSAKNRHCLCTFALGTCEDDKMKERLVFDG